MGRSIDNERARRMLRRRGRRRSSRIRRVPLWPVIPATLLMLGFHYALGSVSFWASLTDWDATVRNPTLIGFDNFQRFFEEPRSRDAFLHTLQLAAVYVVVVNVLGLLLALGLRTLVKTRNFLRTIFFVPVVLSTLATSYIWSYVFDNTGGLNRLLDFVGLDSWERAWLGDPGTALWCIAVTMIWQSLGLTMFIYLAGMQGISDELLEVSAVDGASLWRRFRKIVLPLLVPAITINLALQTIRGLAAFDQIIALTGGGPIHATETLGLAVYQTAFTEGNYSYGAALSIILSALIAVVAVAQVVMLRRYEARSL